MSSAPDVVREVVVVLGVRTNKDGSAPNLMIGRLFKASEICESVSAVGQPHPKVILTGFMALDQIISEAKAMEKVALEEQLFPIEHVILEEKANSTAGNAYWSRIIVDELGATKVHIVTDQFHLERTKLIFNKIYAPKVYELHYHGCAHDPGDETIAERLRKEEEYVKCIDQHIYYVTQDVPYTPLVLLKSPYIDDRHFTHGFTTRSGGISTYKTLATMNMMYSKNRRDPEANVKENRLRLARNCIFDDHSFYFAKCEHKANVWIFGEAEPENYDAIVTSHTGITIAAPGADCMPLLFCDPVKKVCGVAHAGWKGVLAGVAQAVVEIMTMRFSCITRDIRVAIGPSIGPCCFEVGEDVAEQFAKISKDVVIKGEDAPKPFVDLRKTSRILLEGLGIPSLNIDDGTSEIEAVDQPERVTQCTKCDPQNRFFSFRRDGEQYGTQIGFINIKTKLRDSDDETKKKCVIS